MIIKSISMTSLEQILLWLTAYKYLALFPLAVAEGPIITVIAGFFVSLGYLNFWLAYIIIIIGDLAGDALHYSAGRFGGREFIDRWGRFIGINKEKLKAIEAQFAKRGNKLLFAGKMMQGVGGIFLIAAGVIKMPFIKFITANTLATFIKSFLLLLIGFYFGHALSTINTFLERAAFISIGATLLAGLVYSFYFRNSTYAP